MDQTIFNVMPVIFFIIGVAIFFAPTKSLLSWDRRTGYWIYKNTLKSTGDEEKAVKAAEVFYKIFGAIFALVGLMVLMATFLPNQQVDPIVTTPVDKVESQSTQGHP